MRRQITMMVEDAISTATADRELDPQSSRTSMRPGGRWSPSPKDAGGRKGTEGVSLRQPLPSSAGDGGAGAAERVVKTFSTAIWTTTARCPRPGAELATRRQGPGPGRVTFLAGMTDTYAIKEHRRLFDHTPDFV
jgi:dGTPase